MQRNKLIIGGEYDRYSEQSKAKRKTTEAKRIFAVTLSSLKDLRSHAKFLGV